MMDRPLDEAARAYVTAIRRSYKPKTTNRKITAIRGYGLTCGQELLSGYNAPTPLRAMPHPLPEGIDGVMRMLAVARDHREEALVAMCGLMGLRVAEALSVEAHDFDGSDMVLRIRGKGDKERMVPVSDKAWSYMAGAFREAILRGGGVVVPYSDRAAREAITRCGRNAKLSRPVSSHDLRSTFATEAYNKTLDLRAVQELLGHASSTTTEGYTQISRQAMRKAADI